MKRFFSFPIIFMLLCIALLSYVSFNEIKLSIPPKKKANTPDFAFNQVTISHIYNGQLLWELRSNYATIDKDKKEIELQHTHGEFFDQNESLATFTAPMMSINLATYDMRLFKVTANIPVENSHIIILTPELNWRNDHVHGNKGVDIRSDSSHIVGQSYQLNLKTKTMYISKNSRADFFIKG